MRRLKERIGRFFEISFALVVWSLVFSIPLAFAGTIYRLHDRGEIRFIESRANGANYIALRAPASLSGDVTFSMPATDGTTGQFLQTDGSAALSFVTGSGIAVIDVTAAAYGAIADDATDDTAAFETAMAAADGAGLIYIPPGVFDLSDMTPLANGDYTFVGAGEGVTTLRHLGSSTTAMIKQIGAGDTGADDNVNRFFISDLTIDGNRANVADVDLPAIELDVLEFRCERVTFTGTQEAAIQLREIGTRAEITQCLFKDMAKHDATANGETLAIHVTKSVASNSLLWVHHNRIESTDPGVAGDNPGGILVSAADGTPQRCLIESNHLIGLGTEQSTHGNFSACIHIYQNGDDSTIQNNLIEDLAGEGIRVQKSNNIKILHNILRNEVSTNFPTTVDGVINIENRSTNAVKDRFQIIGNTIEGFTTAGGFDYGIYCVADSSNLFTDIDIIGNQINGTGSAVLVRYFDGTIRVNQNVMRGLTHDTNPVVRIQDSTAQSSLEYIGNTVDTADERALVISDGATRDIDVIVRDNHIEDVGNFSAGSAITLNLVDRVLCDNNVFLDMGAVGNYSFTTIADKVLIDGVDYTDHFSTVATVEGARIYSGDVSPETTVAAPEGSLYMRDTGATGTTLYLKETGTTTSSGWVAYGPGADHTGNVTTSAAAGYLRVGSTDYVEWHRDGANVWGTQDSVVVDAALTVGTNATITGDVDVTGSLSAGDTSTSIVIATGVLTVTTNFHVMDTEGNAATDELDTINGGVDGMILTLRQELVTQDVTIRDVSVGSGNIQTISNASVTMNDPEEVIQFIYDASAAEWLMIGPKADN